MCPPAVCAAGVFRFFADGFWLLQGAAPASAPKGNENRRSLRSPFGNLQRRYFWGYLRLVYAVTLGTVGTLTKKAALTVHKLRRGREAVQRATAKPSGRARRREIPAQHAHILWKKAQLNRAEGSRGNAPWKICKSPLQKGENAAIMNGNAQGWGRRRTSLGKRAGEGVSPVKTA